eukprot:scaffold3142_cov119-Cylindrotheca_fusiformis.AAC.3
MKWPCSKGHVQERQEFAVKFPDPPFHRVSSFVVDPKVYDRLSAKSYWHWEDVLLVSCMRRILFQQEKTGYHRQPTCCYQEQSPRTHLILIRGSSNNNNDNQNESREC